MASLPAGRELVVVVATPLVKVDVPSVVLPLVNVTVPVALVGRVAVKVTAWFTLDGLSEEVSATVGCSLFTVWVSVPVAEL
jgi:hypothetical protein